MVAEQRKIRRSDLPPEARELLRQIEARAEQPPNAMRVWNDHFSAAERKELGDEPFLAWKHNGGTAGMWAIAKEVSRERALVDIAYALDWLETAKCEWLLQVIGEKSGDRDQAAVEQRDRRAVVRRRTRPQGGQYDQGQKRGRHSQHMRGEWLAREIR